MSAAVELVRASASAASPATVRSRVSSSPENARRPEVVPTTSTPMTRSFASSGTNAALRAPVACASRGLTIVEACTS